MNDKIKKAGAFTGLSSMALGLIWNAYSQVRVNQVDIVKLNERSQSHKEILIEIKQDVKEIRRLMDGNRVKR